MKLRKNTTVEPTESTAPAEGSGKGRPTPKRREAEKKNQRPLIASKKENKARKRRQREIAYERQRAALNGTGDERYLPVNDRGEVRRYIRNYIDARHSLSEWLMPILLVAIVFMFAMPYLAKSLPPAVLFIPGYAFYALIVVCVIEMAVTTHRINKRILQRFPGGKELKRGNGRYVFYRMTMLRRLRQPVPVVTRGDKAATD